MERSAILLSIDWASDIEFFSSLAKENFFAKIKVLISEFEENFFFQNYSGSHIGMYSLVIALMCDPLYCDSKKSSLQLTHNCRFWNKYSYHYRDQSLQYFEL